MDRGLWADVIKRCLLVTECADITELATVFETSAGEIETVLNEKKPFPKKWLLVCIENFKTNPVWLLTGKGKRFWDPGDQLDEILGQIDEAS